MATVTPFHAVRKSSAIRHYAHYYDVYGTAELLNGSGYLFRKDGARKATLISYKDPELVLLGRCDLADSQRLADEQAGGPAFIACRRQEGRS